jgi:hypothetical protein
VCAGKLTVVTTAVQHLLLLLLMLSLLLLPQEPHTTTISDLPIPVLVSILELVPLRGRLASCALVGSTWDMAARLATAAISTEATRSTYKESLEPWLFNSSSRCLTSLSLTSVRQKRNSSRGCNSQGADALHSGGVNSVAG